jgi:hypothetical protein
LTSLGAVYLQSAVAALPEILAAERALRGLRNEFQEMGGSADLFAELEEIDEDLAFLRAWFAKVAARDTLGAAVAQRRRKRSSRSKRPRLISRSSSVPRKAPLARTRLVPRGVAPERMTLAWNVDRCAARRHGPARTGVASCAPKMRRYESSP